MAHNVLRTEMSSTVPDNTQEKLNKARATKATRLDDAIALYEEVLKNEPDRLEALFEVGMLYFQQEKYHQAYHKLKEAIALEPDNGQLWFIFGRTLYKTFHCDAAVMAFEKAEKLSFMSSRLCIDKAMCLTELNRFEEALETAKKAIELSSGSLAAVHCIGTVSEMNGNRDIARTCYEQILQTRPGEPAILFRLADLKKLSDEQYEQCNPDHPAHANRNLNWENISYLHITKAICNARDKKYDEAFECYAKGNKLIRDEYDFDRNNLITRTELHIHCYTKELFKKYQRAPEHDITPIFIVGMPRSGTTLIEQILSSHSLIGAGGELPYLHRIENSLVSASTSAGQNYPQNVSELTLETMQDFASQYVSFIKRFAVEQAQYLTDKMPPNFMNLGLIAMMFPNAKIIHARRNPIDTCLSCFTNRFNDLEHLSFTFDQEDVAFYYNQYRKLMAHWRKVLPIEIHDVQYEGLLDNQEEVTRGILDYMGLDWEEQCLKFYENARGVKTASLHQVRKPIYKSSSGKWKNYEKHIGPMIAELEKGKDLLP